MRITYDNTPILMSLKVNHNHRWGFPLELNGKINYYEKLELMSIFSESRMNFQEVHLVSKKFNESASKAPQKFLDLFADIKINDSKTTIPIKGTFIYKSFVAFIDCDKSVDKLIYFLFDKKGILYAFSINNDKMNASFVCNDLTSQGFDIVRLVNHAILWHLFKYNADIEINIVARDKKVKLAGEDAPIQNKLDFSLIHLNCKWFTDLIRGKAFSVVGHLRNYGWKVKDGKWYLHIVPVTPHMRSGWKHKANKTKIKQDENTCPAKED